MSGCNGLTLTKSWTWIYDEESSVPTISLLHLPVCTVWLWPQNVVRTSVMHYDGPCVPLFRSYCILTSFVIYSCTYIAEQIQGNMESIC